MKNYPVINSFISHYNNITNAATGRLRKSSC